MYRTLLFCKPYKVLSCFTDGETRPTFADIVKVSGVYAAGRLDYDSEGLLLLTSDGKLAHRITQPQYKLPKVYLVQVENIPQSAALAELHHGVMLHEKRTMPAQVELLPITPKIFPRAEPIAYRHDMPTAWLKITLHEGRKRQVRQMTAAVGHPTLRLIRLKIGPFELGKLLPGQWRDVTQAELEKLRGFVT